MTINYNNKTIELTKDEMKDASLFGSDGYKALREARTDNPGFKIITSKPKKASAFSTLDMATISAYVDGRGSEEQKADFEKLTTDHVDNKTFSIIRAADFLTVKNWFLKNFREELQNCNLTLTSIKRYVERNGNEEQKKEFAAKEQKGFFEVRQWFTETFKEDAVNGKEFNDKRQAILGKIA